MAEDMIKPAKMPILESQQREIDGYLVCLKAEFPYQDWFIMKKESVNNIAATVQKGGFYTILGPPRSQKSFLLGAIKEKLQNKGDHFCVFLDLFKVDSKTDESFFKSFGELFASKMDKPGRDNTHPAFYDINSENSLFLYLQKLLASIEKNLVILIDHSDRIRITPLKSLLNILSKLYNGNQVREREGRHISVVTTNSFRTASLVLDADSSFKFSIIEKMGDLSDEAMNIFMNFISSVTEIEIEKDARILCSQYTSGDPYLMSMLCNRAIEKILELNYFPSRTDIDETNAGVPLPDVVGEREITEEINWFFREEAIEHRPLHEIIESIECDPLIFIDFLELLKNSGKLPVQNRHKIGVNIDKMELTGAVRIIDSGGQKMYEFRNSIYRCCLDKHFHPKHVVDVLTTAGLWKVAIEHLKDQIVSDDDDGAVSCYDPSISRCDNAIRDYIAQLITKPKLLPMLMQTVVNYIYTVDSIHDACNAMIKAMEIAFKKNDYKIYIRNPDRSMLKLFSCSEACKAAPEKIQLKGERCNTPEARTCHNKNYYLDKNGILYIPIIDKKQKLLGLTVLHNFKFKPQNSDSKQLLSFLNQASAALGNVIERETRLQQLKELNMLGKEISRGHLTEYQIFEKTAVKISQVYGTVGASVHLLSQTNDPEKCLKQKTESFYCSLVGNVREIRPRPSGLTYQVLKYQKPYTLENPEKAPGLNPEVLALGVKACMCLPMISRETIYGVFFVYHNENHSFSDNEIEILSLFANQAALAIENTRLMKKYKVLQEISANIVSNLNLEAILKNIAKHIVDLLGADRSLFLLVDMEKRKYIKGTGYNYTQSHIDNFSFQQIKDGISGWVLTHGKGVNIADTQSDYRQRGIALENAKKHRTGPIIVVPLIVKDKIIGTLTAVNKAGSPVFTDEDYDLACMLANQSAIAVENAREIKEIEQIIEREKISVSIAAHEFYSPLEIISSGLELLSRITSPRKEAECQVRDIYNNVNETIDLISFVGKQGTFSDPNWEPHVGLLEVFPTVAWGG
jgi:GAF domain-containing protein